MYSKSTLVTYVRVLILTRKTGKSEMFVKTIVKGAELYYNLIAAQSTYFCPITGKYLGKRCFPLFSYLDGRDCVATMR